MALTKCPECGRQVSDRAKKCPHCGCPIESQTEGISQTQNEQPKTSKPRKSRKRLWITLGIVGVIAIISACLYLFGENIFGKPTLKITPEFTKALERYDQIDAFSEGLAAVRRDGKWGYINLEGEEVIPCQFSDDFPPGQFSEGLACVVDDRAEADKKLWNKRVGFINSKGEWVLTGDYFTESPNIGSVWEEDSHKLPSFKDGKCAIWSNGTQEAFDDNEIKLVDTEGAIFEVSDSIGYKMMQFQPYPCPVPYKDIATTQEDKIVYDDYAITIARDTVECDNGARLVTWQILDANSYPYQTEEKTTQYFIDNHGNSTLTATQQEAMEQHLNGLMASLLDEHNEELRRAAEEEERIRMEKQNLCIHLSAVLHDGSLINRKCKIRGEIYSCGDCGDSMWGAELYSIKVTVPQGEVYTYKRYTKNKVDWQQIFMEVTRNGYSNSYKLNETGDISLYGGDTFIIIMRRPSVNYDRQNSYVDVEGDFYFLVKESEF